MKVVSLEGVSKRYPGVIALDKVDFSLKKGEIHALLGENGAGKSTLMEILYGMRKKDQGSIKIKGEYVELSDSLDAIELGIGMVHQHFMLADALTVLENIIAGLEPIKGLKIDYKKARVEVQNLIDKFSFNIDIDKKVEDLSVGEKQRVEILKVLYRGTDIIILDEPTAVLTPLEVEGLFNTLRELKKEGKSIIIITHKLYEVTEIADFVTVLRDGKVTGHADPKVKTASELANLMVGRQVSRNYNNKEKLGGVKFQVKNINYIKEKRSVLEDINFSIKEGEVLGVAGVEGNGQTELIEILTGQVKDYTGEILLEGKKLEGDVRYFLDREIGHIPEDRLSDAVVGSMDLGENIILGYHNKKEFVNGINIDKKSIYKYADKKREEYNIRSSSSFDLIDELSGGNQQKVVLSRVISQDPKVIICSQPTRGVDIGATEYIHKKLLDFCNRGNSILLLSADLEEVKALSNRIAIMYKGRIVAIKDKKDLSDTDLGILMTGGKLEGGERDEA